MHYFYSIKHVCFNPKFIHLHAMCNIYYATKFLSSDKCSFMTCDNHTLFFSYCTTGSHVFFCIRSPGMSVFFFVWTVAIRTFTCAFFCRLIMSTKQNFINVLYHSSLGTGVWNYIRRSEGSINSSVILVHIELKAHIGLNSLGLVQNRFHHYLIKK